MLVGLQAPEAFLSFLHACPYRKSNSSVLVSLANDSVGFGLGSFDRLAGTVLGISDLLDSFLLCLSLGFSLLLSLSS